MLARFADRIMDAHTTERKVISILLVLSLALMAWDAGAIRQAYAEAEEAASVATQAADDSANNDSGGGSSTESVEQAAPEPEPEPVAVEEPAATEPEPAAAEAVEEPAAEEPAADKTAETPAADESATSEETTDAEATDEEATDDEKAEDEKKADEEAYPAQDFAASANGVAVKVHADKGALPEKATMKVKAVKDEATLAKIEDAVDGEVTSIKAVDITFYDKDSKEVEPKKDVKVSLKSEIIAQAAADDSRDIEVVHVADNGVAEVLDQHNAGTAANEVVVKNDEFSVYAVVETDQTGDDARLFVTFKNGDTEIANIPVKKADTTDADNYATVLYDPGAGELANGVVFKGWTTDPDYTTETTGMTIADVRDSVSEMLAVDPEADGAVTDGQEIIYYAMLFNSYKVTYVIDDNGTVAGADDVLFRAGGDNPSYTVNMQYTVEDAEHNFEGWTVADGSDHISGYTDGKVYANGTEVTLTGDVKFSVSAPAGHWLIFDKNGKGAKYNAPRFIKTGEVTAQPCEDSEMVRQGYTFDGWYTDKNVANQTSGGDKFVFGGTISTTTTLYARWIPNTTANYTVIIWKQNVAGDGYDFYKSVLVEGATVGSTPNAVRTRGTDNDAYAIINGVAYRKGSDDPTIKKDFTGFHYKSTDQADQKVATEGNTVVNVYYDRNEITLNFYTFNERNGYTVSNSTNTHLEYYGRFDNYGYPDNNGGNYYRLYHSTTGNYAYPRNDAYNQY